MEKYYTFDIIGLDVNQQCAIIAEIKKNPIRDNGEIIARAYEWLAEKDFSEFMELWKYNDYPQMVYGNLYGEDCDYFLLAFELNNSDEIRIVWWGR